MNTDQELALAQTLIAAVTPLIEGIFKAHPDKVAAAETLADIIAAAAAAPGEMLVEEAKHDAAAKAALDAKFPTGDAGGK